MSFSRRRFTEIAGFLGVGVLLLLFLRSSDRHAPRAATAPAETDNQSDISVLGSLPPVPSSPAERVVYLIENHPKAEIRVEFAGMIARKEAVIAPMFMAPSYVGASFRALTKQELENGEPYKTLDGSGDPMPTMLVNARLIAKMETKEDALFLMSTLYHEWFHLKDYQAALARGDTVELGLSRMNFDPAYVPSERECEILWSGEMNAWRRMCLFVKDVHIEHMQPLFRVCDFATNEQTFMRSFFTLKHAAGDGADTCAPVNARLSGVPFP